MAWSATSREHRPKFPLGAAVGVLQPLVEVGADAGQRHDRALELDHLAGQLVDPLRRVRVTLEDLQLDLVDVALQAVEDRPVVVHDLVQNAVQHGERPMPQQLRIVLEPPADGAEVGLVGVPDGDHEVRPEEQVDLTGLDDLHRVDVDTRPEHHEQDIAVALQLRALVGLDSVLDRQAVQVELLGDRVDLLRGRVHQPDPAEAVAAGRAGAQLHEGLVEGFRLHHPFAVNVDGVVDHRHGCSESDLRGVARCLPATGSSSAPSRRRCRQSGSCWPPELAISTTSPMPKWSKNHWALAGLRFTQPWETFAPPCEPTDHGRRVHELAVVGDALVEVDLLLVVAGLALAHAVRAGVHDHAGLLVGDHVRPDVRREAGGAEADRHRVDQRAVVEDLHLLRCAPSALATQASCTWMVSVRSVSP